MFEMLKLAKTWNTLIIPRPARLSLLQTDTAGKVFDPRLSRLCQLSSRPHRPIGWLPQRPRTNGRPRLITVPWFHFNWGHSDHFIVIAETRDDETGDSWEGGWGAGGVSSTPDLQPAQTWIMKNYTSTSDGVSSSFACGIWCQCWESCVGIVTWCDPACWDTAHVCVETAGVNVGRGGPRHADSGTHTGAAPQFTGDTPTQQNSESAPGTPGPSDKLIKFSRFDLYIMLLLTSRPWLYCGEWKIDSVTP